MSSIRAVKNYWNRMIDKQKEYKQIAKVHIDLIERLEKYPATTADLNLQEEEVLTKLKEGIPYVEGQEGQINLDYALPLFKELCNWSGLGDSRSSFKRAAKKMSDADVTSLLRAWLIGDGEQVTRHALHFELNVDMLHLILRYSLLPTLYEYTKHFEARKVFDGEEWMKDYCPVCGDQHGLAEFRGSERFRHFRCLSCAADWIYWRIGCPYCHNKEHDRLATLFIEEDKSSYQIDVCEECHGYVKGVNKLDKSGPAFLLLDDFLTIHLDMLALEKGYSKNSSNQQLLQ